MPFSEERPEGRGLHEEQRALIALSLVPGVGPGRIRALISRFGTAAAVLDASRRALAAVPGIGPQTAQAIAAFDDEAAVDAQIARAEQAGAALVASWDPAFPRMLRQIYDPPAFLWVRGRLSEADAQAVAIVGTRRPTDYGRRAAAMFASELARLGITVVSGLAHGIDTAAHRGALEAGGRTVAVLGSGVDRIYPSANTALARDIARQGALLSEQALGAAPDAPNFPRRNRIISGLSLGVLVVEAYASGGALITARLALEQNREVFAVPASIYNKAGTGANQLIQEGHAKLVSSVDDVLDELAPLRAARAARPARAAEPAALNAVEQRLFDALGSEPLHIDALCSRTGIDAPSALAYLLSLEFKGLVRQMAGKQFFRA